jgi:hypothetical protein
MVFDSFRQSFDELLSRATRPEERRVVASRMRDTLVQAKVGLSEMRDALEKARQRLAREEKELETVRRRRQLAEGIGDKETVDIAAKYEEMHGQRVDVVRQKVAAQEAELALADHDVQNMAAELKAVLAGTDPRSAAPALDAEASTDSADRGGADASSLRSELDAMSRSRANAEREADATRRLDELKRRMGK